MNFLQDLVTQLRNAFIAIPLASRIIVVMLIAVIVIGLGILIQSSTSTNDVYLFGGHTFPSSELDRMELAFGQGKLGKYERDGMRIRVPAESKMEYMNALHQAGALPPNLQSPLEEALDKAGLLDSSVKINARMANAKEKKCANAIKNLPFVEHASVQYDYRNEGMMRKSFHTASVMVTPSSTEPLTIVQMKRIRDHVRSSFAGLKDDDIVVTDANASSNSGSAEEENQLIATQRKIEDDYKKKIARHLKGYGPISLEVHATIDPSLGREKVEIKYDPDVVTTHSSQRKRKFNSSREPIGGVAGAAPNTATPANASVQINKKEIETNSSDDTKESQNVVGRTHESTSEAGLQPKRITASIGVPETYYETIRRQRYLKRNPDTSSDAIPPPTAEEEDKLRSEINLTIQLAVSNLLPEGAPGEDPLTRVQVWVQPVIPEQPIPGPTTVSKALSWLADSWQTLGMGLLGLVALLVARSVAQSIPARTPSSVEEGFGLEIPVLETDDESESESEVSFGEMEITGTSLKSELTHLIDDNPEVAANVLRTWMGESA